MNQRPYDTATAKATKGTVYVLGDSLERGFNAPGGGWPTLLGYTNLGVNGAAYSTPNPSVTPEIFLQFNSVPIGAGTVILGGGVNNLGLTFSSHQIASCFLTAERYARAKGAHNVLVKTITPFGSTVLGATTSQLADDNVRRVDFNQWLRETYTPRGQCVDAVASVGGDLMNPSYDSGDGVHLNDAGQAAFAAAVGPIVNSLTL